MSSLIEQRTPACALGLSTETLSAWRDDGLPPDEARRIREHAATCAACQERLAAFDLVARALSRQRELEPGDRIWSGVRARMANARRAGWRASLGGLAGAWRAIAAAACLAAVVALLAYILGNAAARRGPSVTSTPTTPLQPTATATTPTPVPGALTVSDAITARQLSFAYALDGEVWVSLRGAPPQQMTHIGLTDSNVQWYFYWTSDATKLLANASSPDGTHARAWIISLPDGAVTSLPASSPLVEGCANLACHWLGNRYIVFPADFGAHSTDYQVYDTQARRVVPSGLDGQAVTEVEVRGDGIYFTPYEWSDGTHRVPGRIRRASVGGQTVTTSFTLPGALVLDGISFGNWELSADGRHVVSRLSGVDGIAPSCSSTTCYTFYQDSGGETQVVFPSLQTRDPSAIPGEIAISPDGRHAAAIDSYHLTNDPTANERIIQQALPSGSMLTNALPDQSGDWVLGWTADSAGILVGQEVRNSHNVLRAIQVLAAPTGSGGDAHLVETIAATQSITFAQQKIFCCGL